MTLEIHAAIKHAVETYRAKLDAEARLSLEWQKGKPSTATEADCNLARIRHGQAEDALKLAIEREGLAK